LYLYILDPQLTLWVSLEHAFTCVSTTDQAERRSSTAHLLARWEHQRTTARWSRAQAGGLRHSMRVSSHWCCSTLIK